MLFEVTDHVTREVDRSAEVRKCFALGMGTQSEALSYKRGQGLDWEGHK